MVVYMFISHRIRAIVNTRRSLHKLAEKGCQPDNHSVSFQGNPAGCLEDSDSYVRVSFGGGC